MEEVAGHAEVEAMGVGAGAELDPGGVVGRVGVLVGAAEEHVLEPAEAGRLREGVEDAGFAVGSAKLRQALGLLPLLEQPHARADQSVRLVAVAQVRRAQRDEAVEVRPQVLQPRQGRPQDQAPQ